MKSAVILLSGGMDSATCLYWAREKGYRLWALSVDYRQRHGRELRSARRLAHRAKANLSEVSLPLPWLQSSSLVDKRRTLPERNLSMIGRSGIPTTYVPGRNTVFVALGISLADAVGAESVVVGANALDCSGYPDCRPAFYRAFRRVAVLGTKRGAKGQPLRIEAPLIHMNKAEIVRLAFRLGVPLEETWSCYQGGKRPCGRCDSCKLRTKGFYSAGLKDPALD